MTVIGYSTLEVIPSVKGLAKSLEKQTSGDLTTAGRKGGKQFGDAAGREAAVGFKGKFSGAMKGFAPLAGLVAGVGITAFFKDAIDGASGLQEAGTKLQAIYGEAAAEVQNFAATAATDLGQTKLQALDAAATFGTFGKAAKLSGSDLATFSTELVSLSTDLASFFNTDVDAAIQAIGSGLRGEAEPLRQFGVLLDDATLRTEALKQGLIKTTKEALTPQQKVLAAHAVILAQTTDAQGDFARTSGGLANQQRKLTAQWSEMKTAVGQELLPAVTSLVTVLNDQALPALGTVAGVAKDAVTAFAGLPTPILAGVGAFAALRIAAATSIGATLAAGVASVGSAFTGLQIRLLLAKDAFIAARTASITLTGSMAGVSLGAGRLTAALAAVRAGAIGAGVALKAAFASFAWPLALIAGTVALTHFMTKQDKSRELVDDLTASLNKQTGAITAQTRERINQKLEEEGVLKLAEKAGVALGVASRAALGHADAVAEVEKAYTDALEAFKDNPTQELNDQLQATSRLRFALKEYTGETESAVSAGRRLAEANKGAADGASDAARATGTYTGTLSSYRTEIAKTRTELQKLIDKEQKRTLAAIQSQRDELALVTTMQATRKEAREGARTLDINTKAGQANKAALLDLADQWANSTPKARAAIGGYEEMRQQFIKVAREMGATKAEAKTLADELLKVPKRAPIRFQSENYKQTLAEILRLKAEAEALRTTFRLVYATQAGNQQAALADRRASGGMIFGRGTGTSDSNLIWASKGEFMQRKAAVDYYGVEFMRRLNALQVPKFAQGGPIAAPAMASAGPSAPLIDMRGTTVVVPNPKALMDYLQRRTREAQGGGVPA